MDNELKITQISTTIVDKQSDPKQPTPGHEGSVIKL